VHTKLNGIKKKKKKTWVFQNQGSWHFKSGRIQERPNWVRRTGSERTEKKKRKRWRARQKEKRSSKRAGYKVKGGGGGCRGHTGENLKGGGGGGGGGGVGVGGGLRCRDQSEGGVRNAETGEVPSRRISKQKRWAKWTGQRVSRELRKKPQGVDG